MRQNPRILFAQRCTKWNVGPGFCENRTNKEAHFFDYYDDDFHGRGYMIHSFPECRTDIRMVATDETPAYMVNPMIPEIISYYYGPLQKRIKFITILREPVARFHSDFY